MQQGRERIPMTAWYRSTTAKALLVTIVVIVVIVFGLRYWLTSEFGRGVLETRLSSALNRPIRLAGDFSYQILPLPGANGTRLEVYSPDGRWLVLDAGRYLARLSLGQLLKGQIEVVALSVEDASVDLVRLLEKSGPGEGEGEPLINFPAIQSFDLSDVRLFFDGLNSETHLLVREMQVTGLSPGSEAAFKGELALISAQSELVQLRLSGALTLEQDGHISVALSGLNVDTPDWTLYRAEGRVEVVMAETRLVFGLQSNEVSQPVAISANINWSPPFPQDRPGYEISKLSLGLGEEVIEGTGCVLQEARIELHLQLESSILSLDKISALAENLQSGLTGQTADRSDVVSEPDASESDDLELPFDLAVTLDVEQAIYGDTIAEGIAISVGSTPDCPEAL
ncbi:MAG TPA: hypothetical protein VJ984_03965 [Xanthomonadales bacterium]|nr:hypothetical protein [Xanthomonadales bacterium]